MAATKKQTEDIHIDDDVKLLADTLDEVLRYSGDRADEAFVDMKKKAENALLEVKARLGISDSYFAKAQQVANRADGYVREKPWHGVGVGTTLGLIVGLLLARK